MRYFVLCSALFFGLQISSQNQDFLKIDSILKSKVDENHPGIAVGILKDGNIIYEKYFGLSNLQHKVKFDEKTRSNIASTAKQFTALMILCIFAVVLAAFIGHFCLGFHRFYRLHSSAHDKI